MSGSIDIKVSTPGLPLDSWSDQSYCCETAAEGAEYGLASGRNEGEAVITLAKPVSLKSAEGSKKAVFLVPGA
jgi:hypothetical protein